MRNVRQCQVFA